MDAFVTRTPKISHNSVKGQNNSSVLSTSDHNYENSTTDTNRSSLSNSKSLNIPIQQNYNNSSSEVGALNKIKPDRGQRRISDLGGVVVIEKIQKYVQKLSDPNIASVAKVTFVTNAFKVL